MTRTRIVATALVILALTLSLGMPAFSQGKSLTLSMLAGFKEDVLRAKLPEFEKKTGIKAVGTTSSSWTSRGSRRSRSSCCRSPSG